MFGLSSNPKMQYRTDNSPPLDPVLGNINLVNKPSPYRADPIIRPGTFIGYITTGLSLPVFRPKFCMHCSTHAACPTNSVLLLYIALKHWQTVKVIKFLIM
jgi:hypothetical protein